ncbi:MAG: cyanophycinase [Saprospiraceae bacterium]|nr:cyanophycinase [Saprospiraceae bacterium]
MRISFLPLVVLMATFCGSNGSLRPGHPAGMAPQSGKLFIIGGGARPAALLQDLIKTAGLDSQGFALILPLASSEPDTAAYYAIQQFLDLGLPAGKFKKCYFEKNALSPAGLDSLRAAKLIYLTGGDQGKFMEAVGGTPAHAAILEAYQNGATIAGTSAGAAVMSRKMITGNEFKHPEYTGDFRTIEAENIEIAEGLGLLDHCIVDQHFIRRMRMNRLVAVALEHPGETCIGIDESTAIVVEGDSACVAGEGQVVVLRNPSGSQKIQHGLIGGRGLELSVLLPGDCFSLTN